MKVGIVWGILRDAASEWVEDKCPQLGAALAYFTVFSLAILPALAQQKPNTSTQPTDTTKYKFFEYADTFLL